MQGGWKRHLLSHLGLPNEQEIVLLYACPSDREHASGDHFHDSYAINDGFGIGYRNGIYSDGYDPISVGEVVDGLSTTAGFSERLSLPWFAPQAIDWDQFPHLADRSLRRIFTDHSNLDSYFDECHHFAGEPVMRWYVTSRYQHVMPPNHNSCMLFPSDTNPAPRLHQVVTAASRHRGGTHTVFCDGHLKFVSEDIDLHVWRALGTRNGQEPEANADF
jgi:prepilin-type processing-associated H-X9-DG protein